MVKEMRTRDLLKVLRAAGWTPGRTAGSHTKWHCPGNRHTSPVPDGHRMISPGVIRQVMGRVDACDCTNDERIEGAK